MRELPIKYCRHVMEKTGAVANEPNILMFKKLKKAVELRIIAVKNAKRMAVLPEKNVLNI